jgi:transposase
MLERSHMKKDKDFLHWKLGRFSIDWFTDCGDWFLYFRYWKPDKDYQFTSYLVTEIRFSSAGFMTSQYYY